MPSRARLATWGLVALLAIDVALVSLAFRNPFRPAIATVPVSTVTATARGTTSATSTDPAATTASTTTADASAPAPSGGVGAPTVVPIDTTRAWRFTRGTCPGGGAKLSMTDNGGRTWTDVPIALGSISRVQATDATKVLIVGAETPTCRETGLRTTDGGQNWASMGSVSLWYIPAAAPSDVISSAGRTTKPCRPADTVSVSALSATAATVLCASGREMETADGGASWVEVVRGMQAVAVEAKVEANKLVALVAYRADSCAGLQIASLAGGATAKLGCVDLGGRGSDNLIGHVGLGVQVLGWWLVVDEATFRSEDGGKTWSTP